MTRANVHEEVKRLREQNDRLRRVAQGEHERVLNRSTGLVHCERCGANAGETTLQCPGALLSYKQRTLIREGSLEFFNGKWWTSK